MPKKDNPYNLSDQQLLFAAIYHKNGCTNALEAAVEAGYSRNYAKTGTGKLLEIVNPYLSGLKAKASKKHEGQREKNLDALYNIRDLDILDVLGKEEDITIGEEIEKIFVPTLKDLRKVPKPIRQCIASIKQGRYGIEVKFCDRLKAIETINRMLGYNAPDKVEHSGTMSISGYSFEDPEKE